MKTFLRFLPAVMILSSFALAQDTTTNARIDTVIHYQKIMSQQQEEIFNEVVRYKEPLENKNFGVEFNPAYLLFSSAQSYMVISGGFSLFDADRNAEINFPIFFQSGTTEDGNHYTPPLTLFNLDAVYRRFLGQHQDGFFLSGGIRLTHIHGELENGISLLGISIYSPGASDVVTTDKMGVVFGIGYRYFSFSGIYWGTSLSVGRYFSGDTQDIKGVSSDDTKLIVDFELLKFGIAF